MMNTNTASNTPAKGVCTPDTLTISDRFTLGWRYRDWDEVQVAVDTTLSAAIAGFQLPDDLPVVELKRGRGRPKKPMAACPDELTPKQLLAASWEAQLMRKHGKREPWRGRGPPLPADWVVRPEEVAKAVGLSQRAVRLWRKMPAYQAAALEAAVRLTRESIKEIATEVCRRLDIKDQEHLRRLEQWRREHTLRLRLPPKHAQNE
jgi:hypothetical protein